MPKNRRDHWPEAFVSARETSAAASRAVKRGDLRKIASRLYTTNFQEPPEHVVRRNLWQLAASFLPGALIVDRTAIENVPAADGSIFVVTEHKRPIALPGIIIRPRRGVPPLSSDRPFVGGLFLSSPARAFLENTMPSRRREGGVSRTLTREELEVRLAMILRRGGTAALNKLRDECRLVAVELGNAAAFSELDKVIGALQGTRPTPLRTSVGQAHRGGNPFDPERIRLFETLHHDLRSSPPSTRPAVQRSAIGAANLSFFEAYFSNFIEGTKFDVDEAANIVFHGSIHERPEDAHDVVSTWRIVSDSNEMVRTPQDIEHFFELLQARHTLIMAARAKNRPGEFKHQNNRAGSTLFVAPELVRGTLQRGFELYRSLDAPLPRAIFMMFLVAEVHPFADGNGRIARIMMNAELVTGGEERIVIPTVYRNNYLAGLKALSNAGRSEPLIRVLDFAQRWTVAVAWDDFEEAKRELEQCNAFFDPGMADEIGLRLRLPNYRI